MRRGGFAAALRRIDARLGGARHRTIVLTLAAVLALDSADTATVGASSTQLQRSLHVGRAAVGLLIAVTGLVGAAATVPFGSLVDRVHRVRLLAASVVAWGVIMAASTAAGSFPVLVGMRCGLGVATAVASPAVASLIGDYFPEHDRARTYGYVLAGELVGTGAGFVGSGLLAGVDWRASFGALVLPTAFIARWTSTLPEPARRQSAQSEVGRTSIVAAMRRVLSVRTNVVLIIASSLIYFFFAGLQGFGIAFVKQHYGISQSEASLLILLVGGGAVLGVLVGGRVADALARRGVRSARVIVAGAALALSVAALLPALRGAALGPGVALMTCGALCLAASNPPLDAARLDIMDPALWGRAEAARVVLKSGTEAAASLSFGYLSSRVFTGPSGLSDAFSVTLAPLLIGAAIILVVARRTYPADADAARRDGQVGEASGRPALSRATDASRQAAPAVAPP